MGTIYYYSVNAEIVGEHALGNSRADYVTDALGSVVLTLAQDMSVQATARYKPFGSTLVSSGQPLIFGWVGANGYRKTSLPHCDYYVRARTFATTSGRWTTVDPLWPRQKSYRYVSNSPVSYIDPLGLQWPIIFQSPPIIFQSPPTIVEFPPVELPQVPAPPDISSPPNWFPNPTNSQNCPNTPNPVWPDVGFPWENVPLFPTQPVGQHLPPNGPPPPGFRRHDPGEPYCKDLADKYHKVCPYNRLGGSSYEKCQESDWIISLMLKTIAWCECAQLRDEYNRQCAPFGPPDPGHYQQTIDAATQCANCLSIINDRPSPPPEDGPPCTGWQCIEA